MRTLLVGFYLLNPLYIAWLGTKCAAKMTCPNDVDFCFQLWPSGWSSAQLWIDGTSTEFQLTHVFNDPLESLLRSTIRLANGEQSASIEWSDEPGAYIFTFNMLEKEHHLLSVEVNEYSVELPLHRPNDLIKSTTFIVARDFWLHLVYSEMRKLAESFKHKHYRAKRDKSFPK